MSYIVIRQYGKNNEDFLGCLQFETADPWGTTCFGTKYLAAKFPSKEAANSAARKARRVCMGWNATKQRPARPYPRVKFFAKEL